MLNEFIWPAKVYYEDTDAGGVVYYANYLKFFERARTEWLDFLEIDQRLLLSQNLAFVVKNANVSFNRPARLGEKLEIVSSITRLKGASLIFNQQLYLAGDRQMILCEGEFRVVAIRLDTFKTCPIPTEIREKLQDVA